MVSQSSQPAKSKEQPKQPKQPQPRRFALLVTHFCASMGYLFCLLLWVWCAMQLLYPYITRDKALWVIPEPHDQPEITLPQGMPSGADLPQPIAIALVTIITIGMIGCGLYMLVMLPRNIAKKDNESSCTPGSKNPPASEQEAAHHPQRTHCGRH